MSCQVYNNKCVTCEVEFVSYSIPYNQCLSCVKDAFDKGDIKFTRPTSATLVGRSHFGIDPFKSDVVVGSWDADLTIKTTAMKKAVIAKTYDSFMRWVEENNLDRNEHVLVNRQRHIEGVHFSEVILSDTAGYVSQDLIEKAKSRVRNGN